MQKPTAKGRGSQINPMNRFARIEVTADDEHLGSEHLEEDNDSSDSSTPIRTEYYEDHAKSVVSENSSPDIPFRYSLNPYRGCSHGCSYCYARPTHEYYDLSAGLDFETKIFVKYRAPELFQEFLSKPKWVPEPITFSGVTDCYQPAERQFELTRSCLAVALEARQPIAMVTKNALITRDIDLLQSMAKLRVVSVAMSITSLDQNLTKVMEPRTSSPAAKLRAIEQLTSAGIPVHVLVAPVIPGLTDSQIPAILSAVKDAGARTASYILLRLPLTVKPVFLEWLERTHPSQKAKVESWIRSTRGGELYESGYGTRMRGRGAIADQIRSTFKIFAHKYGLDHRDDEPLDTSQFRPPTPRSGQKWLF